MTTLFSILTLYPWVLAAAMIYCLIQIARFYQKKYAELYTSSPDQRTYYPLFAVPLALFLLAAARYASIGDFAGDLLGDLAFFVGGILLAVLSFRLQQLMTGGHR
jgi:hypothetical protein